VRCSQLPDQHHISSQRAKPRRTSSRLTTTA